METFLKSISTCDVSSAVMTLTLVVVCYILYVCWRPSDVWSQYGVRQPPNSSSFSFLNFRTGYKDLVDKHGDTVGLNRARPLLVTRDLDLVKEVMVKDFNNFISRGNNFVSNSPLTNSLLFVKGNDWRRLRRLSTPPFSSGNKLKTIGKTVDEAAETLATFFEECAKKSQLVPLKKTTGQYTSKIIARSAFGLETDCIGKEDDEFTTFSKTMFKKRNKLGRYIGILLFRFPMIQQLLTLTLKLSYFDPVRPTINQYFQTVLKNSVEHRQQLERDGMKCPADFFQQMLDSRSDSVMDHGRTSSKGDSVTPDKPLTDEEVIGQSMLVIFAGFETTASTLQMAMYLLAKHPDVQDKVFSEIQSVVTSQRPTPEEVGQLTYTEQVINETLRLYAPASLITRRALETKTYGSVTIPKGADVLVPIYSILMDERNYPDPHKFDPSRFSEENKAKRNPLAFIPFGQGPRLCLGLRLAYLEIKVALVHVLRRVVLELNQQTEPKSGEDVSITADGLIRVEPTIQLACRLR